jgi:hypothetical protein
MRGTAQMDTDRMRNLTTKIAKRREKAEAGKQDV